MSNCSIWLRERCYHNRHVSSVRRSRSTWVRPGPHQYESELMTSPPLIEPSWTHVMALIEFFMNLRSPN